MSTRSFRAVGIALLSVVVLTSCSAANLLRRPPPTPVVPIDLPLPTQAQLRDFDLAVKTVSDQYIDSKAVSTDWQQSTKTFRDRVTKGVDSTTFFGILDETLGTLKDPDLDITQPAAQPDPSATVPVTASFSGIGMLASLPEPNKDRILVLGVFPGSPAEQAGIKRHDSIVKIDGQPVLYQDRKTVLSRIRGPSGSQVTLTVHTPGQNDRDLVLARSPIAPASTADYKRLPNTNIGYIRPDVSNLVTMRLDTENAIRDLASTHPLDGLVLDLRIMQSPAFPINDMLSIFVNGQVGTLYNRTTKTKLDITGKNIATSQQIPLVLLVSDQTRGIAESYAGMLQELGRARIIGIPTPGRVATIQAIVLPNTQTVLSIPTGEYRGVKDKSWYRQGIQPDIVSKLAWEEYTDDDDPLLPQAVQALTR